MFLWNYHRKKHCGRNRIDHGRPWGTQFTLVSLYSAQITRYRSWFLEYKFTRVNSPFHIGLSTSMYVIFATELFSCSAGEWEFYLYRWVTFLARWRQSARAFRIGGRKLCPSVCLYVKRYLLLQFCIDYNQTWIYMIWAVAAKTWLSQIFHKWRWIEVNRVYISRCGWLYPTSGMPA